MKKSLVISSLIALTFLAACSSASQNVNITPVISAELLDEKSFQGEELEAVRVINQRVTAFNERDVEKYSETYISESAAGIDQTVFKEVKYTITKLISTKFVAVTNNSISVYVHESYQDAPFGSEGDTLYTLKKEDGKWKIQGTD